MLFRSSNDNRDKSVDRINWFRNLNNAQLLKSIMESTTNHSAVDYNQIQGRLMIEKAYKDGLMDDIMSTFPLTESDSS